MKSAHYVSVTKRMYVMWRSTLCAVHVLTLLCFVCLHCVQLRFVKLCHVTFTLCVSTLYSNTVLAVLWLDVPMLNKCYSKTWTKCSCFTLTRRSNAKSYVTAITRLVVIAVLWLAAPWVLSVGYILAVPVPDVLSCTWTTDSVCTWTSCAYYQML